MWLISFESDHVMSTPFTGSRFASPIAMAIFVFGVAPEDGMTVDPPDLPDHLSRAEQEADDDEDPEWQRPRTEQYANGIKFVGVTREQVPPEIRSIVARMHLNYGHPSNRDLIHFVSQQGASLPVLLCIRALHCDTCLRRRKTLRPSPAKLP